MNQPDMILPISTAIRVDDVGWLEGADDRLKNRPARSGLARRHVPDDIRVLHEIGKGLGVKILCNIVLGDWDIKNRLRGVPHLTWDEEGWDAASVVEKNRAYFEECFSILEGSEHLEYGLHGLQHAYFENNVYKSTKFLYPFTRTDEAGHTVFDPLPAEEFDLLLDLFFEIYHDWGFKKDIHVFQSGSGCYGTPDDEFNRTFMRLLREHGVGIWQWGRWPNPCLIKDGTILVKAVSDLFAHWDNGGIDPAIWPDCFIQRGEFAPRPNICGHLLNFIRIQPEKNFDYVPAWIDYFRRVGSHYGALLARDNEAAASQAVHAAYASLDRIDGGYRIDLAPVDAVRTPLVENEFFVTTREKKLPRAVTGARAYIHECRPDHVVYRIERENEAPAVTILY